MKTQYEYKNYTRVLQIQLLGYNSDLYGNVSQALASSNGLAIIALLGQVSRCRSSDVQN